MMLFKYEFKNVKLIFKAITSIGFSFDINFCQSCSYDGCLFMQNRRKLPQRISGNSSFTSFDRSKFTFDRSSKTETFPFELINVRLLVDRSNFLFDRSRGDRVSIELDRRFRLNCLIFSTDRGAHSIDRKKENLKFF